MKKYLLLGVLFFTGCYETEYSPVLSEPAVVLDTVYQPSSHGDGMGLALNSKGGVSPAFTSVDIPAKWAIVFKCQHGKFIVEGTDEKHKALWEKLTRDQKVTVSYREVFHVTDKERRLAKYDFIDAVPNP